MNESIYIFGYGSLIFDEGINGRGMKKIYTEDDLIPNALLDHKREWNAVWNGIRYLGCIRSEKKSIINGVIFKLNHEDKQAFLKSEGSDDLKNPLYEMKDVTNYIVDKIDPKIDPCKRVYTCITTRPMTEGDISVSYIDLVKRGLVKRGKTFEKFFWRTTPQPFSNPRLHRIANG